MVDSMGPSTSAKASLSWIGVAGEKVTQMTIKKSGALLLLAFSWIGMRGTKKEEPLAGTRATEDMPPCKTISGVTRNKQNQEKIPEKLHRMEKEEVPTVRKPIVQVPTVRVPTVQVPIVREPTVQMPTVRVPTNKPSFELYMAMLLKDDERVPTVRAPTGQVPTVREPIVQVPTVQVPSV